MDQVEDNTSPSPSITAIHPDIILSQVLTRLDGPTLACAAASSSHLRRLCTQDHLWHHICTAMWPSLNHPLAASLISTFPAAHRSIFSDSFPSPSTSAPTPTPTPPPSSLISAVDIYYRGKPLFSRFHRTRTHEGWFLTSPLWLDLLDPAELLPTPFIFLLNDDAQLLNDLRDNLSLSWIVIDPTGKRSANLSSRRAVSVRRHWLTGELELVYALLLEESVQCAIKVTCCGKVGGEMHVREVSLTMEDADGRHVIGKDSLVILQRAMESEKRKTVDGEEAKESYEKFSWMKRERRERSMRRDRALDMLAMLLAFSVFTFFFCVLKFRV